MHLNDGRGGPVARCCAYFLNKSFPVKAWSVLWSNCSHTQNLFPPESLLCGSQGRDREQGAESVYSPLQNRLTRNIYRSSRSFLKGANLGEALHVNVMQLSLITQCIGLLCTVACRDLIARVVTHRGASLMFSSVHRHFT